MVRHPIFVARFGEEVQPGLLAGLFEPLTTPIPAMSTSTTRSETAERALAVVLGLADLPVKVAEMITARREFGSIPHIFSHINMTYHIIHFSIVSPSTSPPVLATGIWLDEASVESANIGTGVKKVWAEVYGAWGEFNLGAKQGRKKATERTKLGKVTAGRTGKKVMMPAMPVRDGKVSVA